MIAYVGYAGTSARLRLTHASIATAACALARTDGDLLASIRLLLDGDDLANNRALRQIGLDSRRTPWLPQRAALCVMADLEINRLVFFAPAGWSSNREWGRVGELEPRFALADVEAIESMLHLAYRPQPSLTMRRMKAVS